MFLIEAGNNLPVYINNGKGRLVKHILKKFFLPLPKKKNRKHWVSPVQPWPHSKSGSPAVGGAGSSGLPGGNICLPVASSEGCFLKF